MILHRTKPFKNHIFVGYGKIYIYLWREGIQQNLPHLLQPTAQDCRNRPLCQLSTETIISFSVVVQI